MSDAAGFPRWGRQAACADDEVDAAIFFPESESESEQAVRVCRGCRVRLTCLEFALDTDQRYGIWGGATPLERARLLDVGRELGLFDDVGWSTSGSDDQ